MKKKIVVPYAPILVESTRSIGYSFEAAVADIIDNSISAAATEVQIDFSSQDPQWLIIQDNGWGMSAAELENAMRYGSQSSKESRRKDDLVYDLFLDNNLFCKCFKEICGIDIR